MTLSSRVLIGLGLGLAAGIAIAAAGEPALLGAVEVVRPLGTLWLNGLRMTIVPLVVSLLVTGIASVSAAAATGRVAGRTLTLIALILCGAGIFTAIATPAVLAWLPVPGATAAALRAGFGAATAEPAAAASLGEAIAGMIPSNPIQAAAEGAMLPLVIFSLLFGLAITRLAPDSRDRLLGFFTALGEAMMVIVHWVLQLAPIGVFALVLPVGVESGLGAVGALGYYVVLLCGLCLVATLAMYPLTGVAARVSLRRFAAAAAPAQMVAFSTRSSLASLPAMLEGATGRLGVSAAIAGLVLPLTVSLMRITSPIVDLGSAIFVASIYGMDLSPLQLAAGAGVAVVTSLSAVGLPSQISFMTAHIPVFLVLGVPLEALALLIAVDVIPDTFQTIGNVTADMAATTIVDRQAATDASGDVATPGEQIPHGATGPHPVEAGMATSSSAHPSHRGE